MFRSPASRCSSPCAPFPRTRRRPTGAVSITQEQPRFRRDSSRCCSRSTSRAPGAGGDIRTLALLAACPLLLAIFVLIERRAGESALIPKDVIANRAFASACLAVLLMSAVFFASLLYLPQFMTKALHYSALGAGAGLAPMMCLFAATSFAAGPLYGRLGPKLIISAGAVFITLGILLLSRLDASNGYGALVPGMVVLGIGIGLFYSSITTAAVTALDPSRSSLAGGIVYMFQIAGGAVGLGLNTAIVTSGTEATIDGLVNGINDAFRLDAALAALAVLVVVVRRVQPLRPTTA
jgi:hypothetical protein